jgi:hypothetical protein
MPVNNPHLRKSGSRHIVTNLGDNDLKTASMLLSTYAKLQTPIFLRSLKVLFIYSKFLDSR